MLDNKNLIEILNIEGNEVAVSRQGINNCMVNLTQMAKPYGKRPIDWLKSKEGKEYLAIAEYMNSEVRNPHITYQPMDSKVRNSHFGSSAIITRQGGALGEAGTWCTDFHVALRFAQWLDPAFAWRLDDAIIKFLTGRNVGTLVNTRNLPAPKHREGFRKLEVSLRKHTSLTDLKEIAKQHNVSLHHVKDVLSGNSVSNPILLDLHARAVANFKKGIAFSDWRIRKNGADYGQLTIDFNPQEIAELNGKED